MSDKIDLLIEQFGLEKTTSKKEKLIVEVKQVMIDGHMVEVKVYESPAFKEVTMKSNERRQNRSGHRERIS